MDDDAPRGAPTPPCPLLEAPGVDGLFAAPARRGNASDLAAAPLLAWAAHVLAPRRAAQIGLGDGAGILALCDTLAELDRTVHVAAIALPDEPGPPAAAIAAHARFARPSEAADIDEALEGLADGVIDLLILRPGGASRPSADALLRPRAPGGLLVLLGGAPADLEGPRFALDGSHPGTTPLVLHPGPDAPAPLRRLADLAPGSPGHRQAERILGRVGLAAMTEGGGTPDEADEAFAPDPDAREQIELLRASAGDLRARLEAAEDRHARDVAAMAAMSRIAKTTGGDAWVEARLDLMNADARRRRAALDPRALKARLTRPSLRRQARVVAASALFDPGWYLAAHPDLAAIGSDPAALARHYVRYGALEGRAPGPGFDTRAYYICHRDVAQDGINALAHYELFGRAEGRIVLSAEPYAG